MVAEKLPRRVRRAFAALWLAGAVIAGGLAPVADLRGYPRSGLVYAGAAAGLIVLALGTARGARWAQGTSVVLLALQLLGAIGSGWQLIRGIDASKAHELRRLGVDPTVGVTLNLVYSAIASGLFLWAWRRASR